jgi:glycosyltransferase involved in cell wall biosynthesis
MKPKIIRVSTIGLSLDLLLNGQLKFLSNNFNVIGLSSNDKNLQIVKNREGVKVIGVSMKRRISIFSDLKSLISLCKVFRKEKPQIVHSITPKAGLLCMIAAFLVRVPVRMHTFTGLIFPSKKGMFQRLLIYMDKIICLTATSVYPEGEGVKQDLLRYKITKKPLKVLLKGNLNGIDFNHYKLDEKVRKNVEQLKLSLNIKVNDVIFLFIGRIVKDKGIEELITGFIELRRINHNVKLVLVGTYEQDHDPISHKFLKEINSNNNIISVGFQYDVRSYIALSDILVFPSYREGFPNVPLQCAAFKKALILTDINGCNEIVIHNESGILIPPKDAASLHEAMKYLLNNKDVRDELGEKVYHFVKSNFKQEEVWNSLEKEYMLQLTKYS